MNGKLDRPLKATVLDDDAFRLLAVPFSGPIPYPGTPGLDMDQQFFDPKVDIRPDWLPFRPVDWHHGGDKTMRRAVFGKAVDLGNFMGAGEPDEDGYWVTVWLDHGQRRLETIKRLADRNAAIFGSSETVPGMAKMRNAKGQTVPWAPNTFGAITEWPYWRQTLSTSPQNTHSVLLPMKATLDEVLAAGEAPSVQFWSDIEDALRSLGTSLSEASGTDLPVAKAGQSQAASIERLMQSLDRLMAVVTP